MLIPGISPRFWTSLGLSIFFSFLIPIVILTGLWGLLLAAAQFPCTHPLSTLCLSALLTFLSTFGTGSPWLGLVMISSVTAIVGALFDAYAFSLSRSYH